VVLKSIVRFEQAPLIPARVAFGPEKDRSLVIVRAMYAPTFAGKVTADLGSDEA
jgi:hypothetical protein